MTRIEIFAHEALESPLLETLCKAPADTDTDAGSAGRPFSLIRQVAGRGASGSSLGNDVWPESNIQLVLMVPDSDVDPLLERVQRLREVYPLLGLAVFVSRGWE